MSDIKMKLAVEGEEKFKKAIKDIDAQYKVLKSEMNLVKSTFGENEKSVESLTATNEVLEKQIEAQKNKLGVMNKALDYVKENFEDAGNRTLDWQKNINNTQATLNLLQRQLEQNNADIEGFTIAVVNSEKSIQELDDQYATLRSELKEIKSAYADNEQSVESLTAVNEKLEEAIELNKKKLDESEKTLKIAASAFGETDEITVIWQKNIGITQEELKELQRQLEQNKTDIEAFAVSADEAAEGVDDLGQEATDTVAEMSGLKKILSENKEQIKDFAEKGADAAARGIAALAASVTAAIASLTALVKSGGEWADALNTTATQTGISTEQLQKFEYAMRFIDVDMNVLTTSMAKMAKNMNDFTRGTGEALPALQALNIQVTDSNGNLRDSQAVYAEVIDALGKVENQTQRDVYAMQIFGESAQQLNPLILAGGDALQRYTDEAERMGIVLDEQAIAALQEFDDASQRLTAQFSSLKNSIAAAFAPVSREVADQMAEMVKELKTNLASPEVQAAIKKLGDTVGKLITRVADMAAKWLPKLANGLQWVVNNAKILLAVLGTLYVGFKTMSIVTKVGDFLKTLGITSVTTAKSVDVLTTSTKAYHTASLGVAGAVAALAIGLYSLCKDGVEKNIEEYEKLTADAIALKTATEEYTEANKELHDSYSDSKTVTEETATAALTYVNRLRDLEKQGRLTGSEAEEYKETLLKIKTLIPAVNAEIDEETGLLKESADALAKQIEKWREKTILEAAQETFTEQLKAQISLQAALVTAERKYNQAKEKRNALEKAYNDMILSREPNPTPSIDNPYAGVSKQDFEEMVFNAIAAEEALAAQLDETRERLIAAQEETDDLAGIITDLSIEEEAAVEVMGEHNKKLEELRESYAVAPLDIEATAQAMTDLRDAEESVKKMTVELRDITTDAFEKMKQKGMTSVTDLIDNLRSNRTAVEEWSANLMTLSEKGVAEDLIEYFRELGPEYAKTVKALVDATEEQLAALENEWALSAQSAESIGEDWSKYLSAGITSGIEENLAALKRAARRMAAAMNDEFRNYNLIKSPSRLYRQNMDYIVQGLTDEASAKLTELKQTGRGMGEAINTGFATTSVNGVDYDVSAARNVALVATQTPGANNAVYITVTDPSPAYMDYLFDKFDIEFGDN